MRISFKDVGQGDSIIIEWQDDKGQEKIGIIDCKLRGRTNPILEYLRTKEYKEIAFLILSHPHADHYSGYLELLDYLEKEDILILRMGHTVGFNGVESYWKYFEVDTQHTDQLTAIKKKWFHLVQKKHIRRMDFVFDGKVMKIDDRMCITCLAPSHADLAEFQRRVRLDEIKNEKMASQAANLLSTLLRVSFDGYDFLFTSDTENFAFLGALERERHHLEGIQYHVCQLAHHGSAKNYDRIFWSTIQNFKVQNAIASAGSGYNHPSFEVLKAFYDNGYEVHCTNIVNGMKDFVKMIEQKSKALDCFSVLAEEYRRPNDRIFEIQNGTVKLL